LLRTVVIEYYNNTLRVGNFQQKNNSAEDGIDETNGLFRIQAVRGTENSRNSVPNHSEEEKNALNSVQWIKKKKQALGFGSESFRRRENNSEFRSVELKTEANFRNFVTKHSAEENALSILCELFWLFYKTIFFA
jgi:hypothetical protein